MDEIVHVSLRLPRKLRDALVDLATRERRSMHAQIVYLIEGATGESDTVKRRRPKRTAAGRAPTGATGKGEG